MAIGELPFVLLLFIQHLAGFRQTGKLVVLVPKLAGHLA